MIVKLTHDEVLEACREWCEKHHGLKMPEKATAYFASIHGNSGVASRVAIEFEGVEKRDQPYR